MFRNASVDNSEPSYAFLEKVAPIVGRSFWKTVWNSVDKLRRGRGRGGRNGSSETNDAAGNSPESLSCPRSRRKSRFLLALRGRQLIVIPRERDRDYAETSSGMRTAFHPPPTVFRKNQRTSLYLVVTVFSRKIYSPFVRSICSTVRRDKIWILR